MFFLPPPTSPGPVAGHCYPWTRSGVALDTLSEHGIGSRNARNENRLPLLRRQALQSCRACPITSWLHACTLACGIAGSKRTLPGPQTVFPRGLSLRCRMPVSVVALESSLVPRQTSAVTCLGFYQPSGLKDTGSPPLHTVRVSKEDGPHYHCLVFMAAESSCCTHLNFLTLLPRR